MKKKKSNRMPGTIKAMGVGSLQAKTVQTMPGGSMSSRGNEEGGGMPGGSMASRGDEKGGGMPGGSMTSKGEEEGGGMPGGEMSGGGGGKHGKDGGGPETPRSRSCATMNVHRQLLSSNPAYARARDQIENLTLLYKRGLRSLQRPGITRIPVVVHVVWKTATQNISDAQITSQIDVLNRDFRRSNSDVSSTPAPFLPLTADARIEFYLANVDPGGAPTTGITRFNTSLDSFTDDRVKARATGGADAWPADRYLNIWVCQLEPGLGYAQFPGGPAATDGVVILHSAFGTKGTAVPPFHLGRTATHEIGHWLNLYHIWGDDGTGCTGRQGR